TQASRPPRPPRRTQNYPPRRCVQSPCRRWVSVSAQNPPWFAHEPEQPAPLSLHSSLPPGSTVPTLPPPVRCRPPAWTKYRGAPVDELCHTSPAAAGALPPQSIRHPCFAAPLLSAATPWRPAPAPKLMPVAALCVPYPPGPHTAPS